MRLSELMQQRVLTIDSQASASAAWSQMKRNRIRHLVVTSESELAGVISERDLSGPHGEEARKSRSVEELMSPRIVSGTPRMTLREAANLMRGRIIGSLPVLEGGHLVGIVTATDVFDALGRGAIRPKRHPERRSLSMTASRRQPTAKTRQPHVREGTGRVRLRQPQNAGPARLAKMLPKISARGSPRGAPQIPARVRASEGDLGMGDRAYIRRELGRRLGKFAAAIERVSVRTEDVDGPQGNIDRMCRIKVVLKGLPSVVLERRDTSLTAAVDEALAGAEAALSRVLRHQR